MRWRAYLDADVHGLGVIRTTAAEDGNMLAATVLLDPFYKRIVKKGKPVARRGRKATGFEKRRPGCHYVSRSLCAFAWLKK